MSATLTCRTCGTVFERTVPMETQGYCSAACRREAGEKLRRAAPDMARALLANGYIRTAGDERWHTDVCNELHDASRKCIPACETARAALIKAGVLP